MARKATYEAEYSTLHEGWVVRKHEDGGSTFVCQTRHGFGERDLGKDDAQLIAALLNAAGSGLAPDPWPRDDAADETNEAKWRRIEATYREAQARGRAWRAGKDRMLLSDAVSWGEGAHRMLSQGEKVANIAHAGPVLLEALAVLWEQNRAQAIELRHLRESYACVHTRLEEVRGALQTADGLLAEEAAARQAAQQDATRWRKFINAARIRILGSARLGQPSGHMGLEIWGQFPAADLKPGDVAASREEVTTLVDGFPDPTPPAPPAADGPPRLRVTAPPTGPSGPPTWSA